jgi:hypothetical protein
MSNLDNIRLADIVLEEPKKISQFVENQFPSIYRENGRDLIELVKSYYRFLESETNQSIYNTRRMYDYRNIDTTLDRMLLFFKNKFLNGLFLEEDTRFIVKNILDLYTRKGSKEGIELFFRLFFDEEVEVFFPSINMFKPSQSKWKEGKYLQLNVVTETTVFAGSINRKIFGSLSNAEAFVDSVLFINIRDSIVPIVFISNVKGQFREFDTIFSIDPFVQYGSLYGSLNTVEVEQIDVGLFSSDNRIGDFVEILTTTEGIGAKGRVSEVSEDLSGEIGFSIENGGFAYTVSTNPGDPDYNPFSETEVLISNQSLFLNNPNLDFIPQERVKQVNTFDVEVIGIVIGQRTDSLGILLDDTAPDANSEFFLFESNVPVETMDRDTNISRDIIFVTDVNDSSSFEVASITNAETVNIVIDVIEDFLSVQLDEADYNDTADNPFSGSANTVNLDTALNEAFAPQDFTIGSVSGFKNINPGFSYINDVFVLLKESVFSRFNLRNQIFTLEPSTVNFFIGDIITQQRVIEDFEGNEQTKTIKGEIVRVEGQNIFVKQLSFNSFVANKTEINGGIPSLVPIPIFKQGISTPVIVNAISRDSTSLPAGLNARIRGDATFSSGKIKAIDIIDSGFGYNKNEDVLLLNVDKKQRILNQIENSTSNTEIEDLLLTLELIDQNKDAVGTAIVSSQGAAEGRWLSFESHISQDSVIQDSFFFQDYSYEISTATPQSVFEETFNELIHPSGIKFFTKFAKTDVINSKSIIRGAVIADFGAVIDLSETIETANNGFNYLISEE